MTEQTQTTAESANKAPKAKTVSTDMDSRRVFPNAEEAAAYLSAQGETLADFGSYPLAAPGIDSEGNFDPAIYTDSAEVMVSVLKNVAKKKDGISIPGSVKAIVVVPTPKLDVLLSREDGRDWVQRIIYKELNHVAVRALREAADISTVVDQIPTTIEGFITSGRDGSSGIMESFNELYKPVTTILANNVKAWARAKLIKSELKRCLESRAYALEVWSKLEDRGEGNDSLFVSALHLFISGAKKKGLDPTIFERWLETRDAKAFEIEEDEGDDSFDLDSLTESLLAEPAQPEAATA